MTCLTTSKLSRPRTARHIDLNKVANCCEGVLKTEREERCQDLIDDRGVQGKRITKLMKLLTRMLTNPPEASELPKAVQLMHDQNTKIADNLEWAAKNDMIVEAKPSGVKGPKKKKRQTEI